MDLRPLFRALGSLQKVIEREFEARFDAPSSLECDTLFAQNADAHENCVLSKALTKTIPAWPWFVQASFDLAPRFRKGYVSHGIEDDRRIR